MFRLISSKIFLIFVLQWFIINGLYIFKSKLQKNCYSIISKNLKINLALIFVLGLFNSPVYSQCKANISSDASICLGGSITIPSDKDGKWNSSEDNFKTEKYSFRNVSITPSVTTTYKFVVKDCADTSKVVITVNPIPAKPAFDYTKDKCLNELIEFTNTTSGSGLSYKWDFGGGKTSTLINPTYIFPVVFGNGVSNFNVSLEATNALGCKN